MEPKNDGFYIIGISSSRGSFSGSMLNFGGVPYMDPMGLFPSLIDCFRLFQVMLISHQWAGRRHPDPKFEQFTVLQKASPRKERWLFAMKFVAYITRHFRYLKWRYENLFKLYGYGLCKGKPIPKMALSGYNTSILGT